MHTILTFDRFAHKIDLELYKNSYDPSFFTTIKYFLNFKELNQFKYELSTKECSHLQECEKIREIVLYLIDQKIEFQLNEDADSYYKTAVEEANKKKNIASEAKELLKKKSISEEEITSLKFKRSIKEYQKESVNHLIKIPYSANFSVPGSGKTTIVYAAYSRLIDQQEITKMLVIGPSAAFIAWSEEYEKCFGEKPKKLIRICGPKNKRLRIYANAGHFDIFITTYQTAVKDTTELKELLSSGSFLLVLDESHNIKRFEGGVWATEIQKLSEYSKRRIILSGTPIPNNILDAWSQFRFLDPSILGPQGQFKLQMRRNDATAILKDTVSCYFRRIKKQDLDLPTPHFQLIRVKPKKIQAEIIKAISEASLAELKLEKQDKEAMKVLRRAITIRLMQASSNPSLLMEKSTEFNLATLSEDSSYSSLKPSVIDLIKHYSKFETPSKLDEVEKLARYLVTKKNKKVLIWSVWIHNIHDMAKRLSDLNPVKLFGDVPINEEHDPLFNREILIKRFKSPDSSCKVMIANPGACGESISLHDVCHDAIYLDRTFNCGQYLQSLDRIHRVGLKASDKITYYIFLVENTIDETIQNRLETKRDNMLELLDDDFKVVNFETKLEEIFGVAEEEQKDFNSVIKDLTKWQHD